VFWHVYLLIAQCAKEVLSDSSELVDFAVEQVDFVCHLPMASEVFLGKF